MTVTRRLTGWGRYPQLTTAVHTPRTPEALCALVRTLPTTIARGLGRAYGDSAVHPDATIDCTQLDRLLAFDPTTGQLVAEAGVSLQTILATFLPRGWFPAVTPGTKHVTVGGMLAAAVHGKNHHREGSIARWVDWIDLVNPDGSVSRCSPTEDAERFHATLGGMGLTGVILRAAMRLRPIETGWIRQTTHPARDLAEVMRIFEATHEATYSVAWIDCLARGAALGRAVVYTGEHARRDALTPAEHRDPFAMRPRRRLAVPVELPAGLLNRWTVRAFNALYHRAAHRGPRTRLVAWDPFFYPLDAITGWNRIYGPRGFVQWQGVLPLTRAADGLRTILHATGQAGAGSFLAVLKRFGPETSPIAFPMEGYTVALDFPIAPATMALLDRLDAILLAHDGRGYLAKDARMSAATAHAADPRLAAFAQLRATRGWSAPIRSAQSERLAL